MKRILFLLGLLLLFGCSTPQSKQPYPDVKVSRLLRVIDGDTFACDIDEHSAIAGKNISIRLRGINTPELRSRNEEERKSAIREKQRLSNLLTNARVIELRNIDRDKYFRIDADVYIDGEPLLPKLNQQYLTGGK
ncbi:thermonuclease family protein [Victivallis vadensis]|uniref:Thermonuclease family protein n=1 Tax=Victivallis vadensis TaxID=172901 RepID=A0A848ATX3_9BACT|nr:thermonuclease family protein [Victivallis vadensis]NMD85683.1 thermonuclease family protein [Victivallis vadensis]